MADRTEMDTRKVVSLTSTKSSALSLEIGLAPATWEQAMTHLAMLQACYPSSQSQADMKAKLAIFYEDLRHLTEIELREACRLYRTNGENRFMATSGHLLELAGEVKRRAAYLDTDERGWIDRLRIFFGRDPIFPQGLWYPQWGPSPDDPACRAAPSLIAKFKLGFS